jgi:drug/metabolite transporter (DMT)-like permease
MTGVGWALNLVAAMAWSVNDVLRKRLAGEVAPVPLAALLAWGPVPFYLVWAAALGATPRFDGYLLPGLGSIALNVVANVLFVASLRVSPLATTIPVLSLTPALSTLAAWGMLGEVPSPVVLGAVAVIVVGTLVLPFAGGLSLHKVRQQAGVPMMAGVALCWASTMVLDKLGAGLVGVPLHLAVSTGGVGVLLTGVLLATGRGAELRPSRDQRGLLALVVVLVSVAMGVQLLALERMPVAVVDATKRAVGMGLAAVVGRVVFREELTVVQGVVLGALTVAIGVMGAAG